MAKHDITSVDSPVVVYVSDEEVYLYPCSRRDHLWEQTDYGSLYLPERKSREQLRVEVWGRLRERLRSPEYGYA